MLGHASRLLVWPNTSSTRSRSSGPATWRCIRVRVHVGCISQGPWPILSSCVRSGDWSVASHVGPAALGLRGGVTAHWLIETNNPASSGSPVGSLHGNYGMITRMLHGHDFDLSAVPPHGWPRIRQTDQGAAWSAESRSQSGARPPRSAAARCREGGVLPVSFCSRNQVLHDPLIE